MIATRISQIPTHRFKIDVYAEYAELAQLLDQDVKYIVKNIDLTPAEGRSTVDRKGMYTHLLHQPRLIICAQYL